MPFETNVFVNCPFDEAYRPLLRPLLFTVIYLGFQPRIALESVDSAQPRLERIIRLIRESKFGIHDLSRCQSTAAGEYYRLNMPFELGLDFGCRHYGGQRMRERKLLVLEAKPYRYQAAVSDLAGIDIEAHDDEPYLLIGKVRNWLCNVTSRSASAPALIEGKFTDFMAYDYERLHGSGFSLRDIAALPVPELIQNMSGWVAAQAAAP